VFRAFLHILFLMHSRILYLFSWLIAGVLAASSNNSTSICHALSYAIPGTVVFPEDEQYNASISSYPFIQLRLHPTCVVRPETAEQVSTAITILTQNKRTRFSVKGGGHNANAGFSNIQDGVTIDMQSIKAVELELGNKVVRVGAGALSQDVYDVVEKRNLSALAGRIGVVGVAGFTTGGMCYHYLNCLRLTHEFTADSIFH
jgi:FAD/FMN-containing dehydrogenase